MSGKETKFLSGFTPADKSAWEALALKALKGAPLDKLISRTLDGLDIRPLYTGADWPAQDQSGLPGSAPFARGAHAPDTRGAWEICQPVALAAPADANKSLLDDLMKGGSGVFLSLNNGLTQGAGEADFADGIGAYAIADFVTLLKGVELDIAPVHLYAGASGFAAGACLAALAAEADLALDNTEFRFNIDPLGALAATGTLASGLDAALTALGAAAKAWGKGGPRVAGVDTRVYHNAGATEAQEIAYALSTGLAYVRALTAAGLDGAQAGRLSFTLVTDADFFLSIAKLRAFSRCWGQVMTEIWPGQTDLPHEVHAVTSARMMTRRDVTVNMLRTTSAAFAAALGGADAITVLPFTDRCGPASDFARRIARNIQIILDEESNVAKVADPAGGAYALESLTDDLAKAAWVLFQEIEAAGGMGAALTSGLIQKQIAAKAEERRRAIARRKLPLTGVSEFPALDEKDFAAAAIDLTAAKAARAAAASAALGAPDCVKALGAVGGKTGEALIAALTAAARAGATIEQMNEAMTGTATTAEPLPLRLLDQDFEALRAKSDAYAEKAGTRPRVFLVNIGPVAAFTARANYAKAFFEAGGIEAVMTDGFSDAADAAAAFEDSAAPLAVLCSSDALYAEHGAAFARAVKQAGARTLYFAGKPGDLEAALSEAGIDEFVHVGCDVAATLARAYQVIGG